ncbi:ATP-dependent DNA ligase LigC [Arcticibacter svalbardensis MN12-7]|uniref:DNA ligase (ATP) n=1 Tax=Arcticibacter svalbardensis MN12-7 TaxID=1150600 RepID=R9GQR0_9SPHI|nr:ATP-dependent DNA ligase [Arcticibacter svalbardensis]EOR94061.1 ATP-dependent DNA ligase LigC [Arcticibacter svalbardensis MN12-7]
MKDFAKLFADLDETNKTNEKIRILKAYFMYVPDADKINTLALFTGRKPKRQINSTLVKTWAMELSKIPVWLFEESYQVVGDLGETIALLLPEPEGSQDKSLTEWIAEINNLASLKEEERKLWLVSSWAVMDRQERFVFNKILTGSFRVGVSQSLIVKALADISGLDASVLTHRIMGNWDPLHFSFHDLMQEQDASDDISRPYPFCLAYPIQETSTQVKSAEEMELALGNPEAWQAEWKWDGIRAQAIYRDKEIFIWSRGEDLVTDKFPELHRFMMDLPDGTVLDGEAICFSGECPLPFNVLQTRIGRKNLTKKILTESPMAFIAYDCLEYQGDDIRSMPLKYRRSILEKLHAESPHQDIFRLSAIVGFSNWKDLYALRLQSRENVAEGFMLKRIESVYQTGRKRGDWWKWKVDPLSVDAVMIYAQKGHGRRADLYSDYTFAVWDGDKLVPFAKAYSGLTDKEMSQVDQYVKRNTLEKFGPVRTVKPGLVFEIGFEGINQSSRHKSGVSLRFPRILRWRHDKKIEDADHIEVLRALLG